MSTIASGLALTILCLLVPGRARSQGPSSHYRRVPSTPSAQDPLETLEPQCGSAALPKLCRPRKHAVNLSDSRRTPHDCEV
jgi:hypothetical protein